MTVLEESPVIRARPAVVPGVSGACRVPLLGQAFADYRRRGRWAITRGDGVNAPAEGAELALSEYLDVLRERRLRPLFVDVPDPTPYARRGFHTQPHRRTAVLCLSEYSIAAAEPALRRDIETADRAGVQVRPYRPAHATQVAQFAPAILRTGPEAEVRVAVGPDGAVLAVAVWEPGAQPSGHGTDRVDLLATRVLTEVATRPHAPKGVVEFLIADAVDEYGWRGIDRLQLGEEPAAIWWPAPGGADATCVLPLLARFGPRWETRWLAIPSGWLLPAAAWALRRSRTGDRA